MDGFQPQYIFQSELQAFGLPCVEDLPNVMNLVEAASTLIDEYCGRVDGDGNGSLVWTTYTERALLPQGRNIMRTMFTPLASIPQSTINELSASADAGNPSLYTGVQANVVTLADKVTLSAFIGASGRYGYGRRGSQMIYPDLNYGANVLQIASFFGGPPNFTTIDIGTIDFDLRTGEYWLPAGLYLSQYTEVLLIYNSGYDPRKMPRAIKHACAAIVKNLMARGGGTTGLRSLNAAAVGGSFYDEIIDPTVMRMLAPYVVVVAY